MGDEEAEYKFEFLDEVPEGEEAVSNWVARAGRARVTYPNGHTFEGTFDEEKQKQGHGVYVWMAPGGDDDEELKEVARYEGEYKDGMKHGVGRMTFPSGDTYHGEWFENQIQGEGTYMYKESGDIYSGGWQAGKKHGAGRYEFGADQSQMVGTWEEGKLNSGQWLFKSAGGYNGSFVDGQPLGEGTFTHANGISQAGFYEVFKTPEEQEDEDAKGTLVWRGNNVANM